MAKGLSTYGVQVLRELEHQAPHDYAPTCYREDGSVIMTGDDWREQERTYFEEFVPSEVAAEIERRLKELENWEYEQTMPWLPARKRPAFEEMEE